jgi:hypothetical protein
MADNQMMQAGGGRLPQRRSLSPAQVRAREARRKVAAAFGIDPDVRTWSTEQRADAHKLGLFSNDQPVTPPLQTPGMPQGKQGPTVLPGRPVVPPIDTFTSTVEGVVGGPRRSKGLRLTASDLRRLGLL